MSRIVLVAILLLSVFCASATAGEAEKFLNSTFEPGQPTTTSQILPSGDYLLVTADGVETYVLEAATGKPLSDRQKIADLLTADSKNRSGYDTKVASALALESDVKKAKNKTEFDCLRLTGIEMHECSDRDSCIYACKSNPNCDTMLYSDGFWEEILEWNSARKGFEAALASYANGLDAVKTDTSAIDGKISKLNELSAFSKNMTSSQLFLNRSDEGCSGKNATLRCFEYCRKVDYSVGRIDAERQSLLALKNAIVGAQQQLARADAILNASAKSDAYVLSRGRDFAELKLKMANGLSKLGADYAEFSARISDQGIPPQIAALGNLSARIVALGNNGTYKSALDMKKDYEQNYSYISDQMQSELSQYGALLAAIDSAEEKIGKGAWLLGNQTAADYKAQLGQIRANLTSAPVGQQKLITTKSDLEQLAGRLSDEITAKATQGGAALGIGQNGKQGLLPCLPAFAVLSIGFIAFFRR